MRGVDAICDEVDGEILSPKRVPNGRAKVRVVFDEENTHPALLALLLKPKLNQQVHPAWCTALLSSSSSIPREDKTMIKKWMPHLTRKQGLVVGASALLILGAAGGAGAMALTRPTVEMAPMVTTAVARLANARGIVSVRGRVAEVYGDRFLIRDATGRALVDGGRRAMDSLRPNDSVLVQGRFDDGQLHARYLVDASGAVQEVGPPPPPAGHRGPPVPAGTGAPPPPPPSSADMSTPPDGAGAPPLPVAGVAPSPPAGPATPIPAQAPMGIARPQPAQMRAR